MEGEANPNGLVSDHIELSALLKLAHRPHVAQLLQAAMTDIEKRLDKQQQTSGTKTDSKATESSTPQSAARLKLTTYAWDQSDKFVKIYVNSPAAEDVVKETHVKFECNQDSVELLLDEVEGKSYQFTIKGLLHHVDIEKSIFKVKKDSVLLMLKKVKERTNWETLTALEHKSVKAKKDELKVDDKADPQASMMKMMKQMYDDGDDEMKRTIKKSMFEAQNKKGGGGGMGGMMGDMGMGGSGAGGMNF